jgi:hypothetical protein
MKDVEEYLDRVCRDLSAPPSLRRHLREELRTHIEEATARHQASGVAPEEAARMAVEEFGDPEMVRDELQGVYGRRLVSLLIDRAMEWKVRTMTSEWKWGFVGQFAVLLVIAIQLILISATAVLIIPQAVEQYDSLRIDAPRYLIGIIKVLRFFGLTWYIWALLVLFGAVIFEWRGPKSGKSLVRIGVGAWAALALTVAAFVVTGGVMISLARASREARPAKPETAIFHAVEQANALYARLTQKAGGEDRRNVRELASALHDELRFLSDTGSAAPILVGMKKRDHIDEIRQLLARAAELSDDIADSTRAGEQNLTTKYLSELELTYGRLTASVAGGPPSSSPSPNGQR